MDIDRPSPKDAPNRGKYSAGGGNDIAEIARSNAASVLRRTIEVCMEEGDARVLLALSGALMDRGYGKAVAGETPLPSVKDVKAAWGVLEDEV